jgi:prolyl 4-hydroxylase
MTPTVTPELTKWIVTVAQHGLSPTQTLSVMMKAGWSEPAAHAAICSALSAEVRRTCPDGPAPAPAPQPDLADWPLEIDAGDRVVRILASMQAPPVVLFGDLLSPEECDALIQDAAPRMARSTVVSPTGDPGLVHEARTSNGMFFKRGETEVVQRLEARIARLLRWPLEHGEGLQVLQYGPGTEYKPHYDYFGPEKMSSERHIRRGGQRVGTLLIYLSDVPKGGGTVLPDAGGLMVPAARGNALYFGYALAHPASQSLHGGSPVIEGEKWVATKWLREGEFV